MINLRATMNSPFKSQYQALVNRFDTLMSEVFIYHFFAFLASQNINRMSGASFVG